MKKNLWTTLMAFALLTSSPAFAGGGSSPVNCTDPVLEEVLDVEVKSEDPFGKIRPVKAEIIVSDCVRFQRRHLRLVLENVDNQGTRHTFSSAAIFVFQALDQEGRLLKTEIHNKNLSGEPQATVEHVFSDVSPFLQTVRSGGALGVSATDSKNWASGTLLVKRH